jgi:Xaa-Pro dipeptidase
LRSPCAGNKREISKNMIFLLGLNKLRTKRVLEEGMAITIEPGCYFVEYLLEKSFNDPNVACYLNKAKVNFYF